MSRKPLDKCLVLAYSPPTWRAEHDWDAIETMETEGEDDAKGTGEEAEGV
jgi:hypothetical protein